MNGTQEFSKKSLSEVAVIYIKHKILSGEFKSGDRLIETEISEDLGISRAPVREAMRELSMQGLITFAPRKSNQILELSMREMEEVFDIRITLEKKIIEILLDEQLLTPKDFEYLRGLIYQMYHSEGAVLSPHEKIYLLNTLDIQFHGHLWKTAQSPRRERILEGLYYQLLIAMNREVVTLGTFEEKAVEHERILVALEANDGAEALLLFEQHILEYIDAVKRDL